MVYVCSDDDEKAKQRHKIFDRWHRNSEYKQVVLKIDNIIDVRIDDLNIQKLYTSFMFHRSNPNYNKLIEIYNQIKDTLNSK